MKRSLRYLRIAFSATCLIACVLLIALWVRSYWVHDLLEGNVWGKNFYVMDVQSQLAFQTSDDAKPWKWRLRHQHLWGQTNNLFFDPLPEQRSDGDLYISVPRIVSIFFTPKGTEIKVRIWLLAVLCALFGVLVVVLRPRFSLRTLLIATTLIALVLGAIVYATR